MNKKIKLKELIEKANGCYTIKKLSKESITMDDYVIYFMDKDNMSILVTKGE